MRKRKSKRAPKMRSPRVSKTSQEQRDVALEELYNGRSQVAVSSMYHGACDKESVASFEKYLKEYRGYKDTIQEMLGACLEVIATSNIPGRQVSVEILEQVQKIIGEKLKEILKVDRLSRQLSAWKQLVKK